MPLGDSITRGYGGAGTVSEQGGYRAPLWTSLVASGRSGDFVGSLQGGPVGTDRDHEGHDGYRTDQIAAGVTAWLAAAQPDVILLHIGTNDLIQGHPTASAVASFSALLDQIIAQRPQARVLVASIIGVRVPNDYGVDPQQITDYNTGLREAVLARAQQGKLVTFVDMNARVGLTLADYSADGLHPNDSGYAKMASVWLTPLAPLLGP